MKKYFSYILLMIIGFVCFTSNVFATFTVERTGGSGKTAIYSVKSSIKYSKEYVSVTPGDGVGSATIKWNDDGISGTLTVTFTSSDCKGNVTINYKADEGCEGVTPKNCEAILNDARSMVGRIPYEMAAKCASTSYEECQFNRIWTDKYPTIPKITSSTPGNYPNNLTRHGDGKGHTGLDCSGFVWWIFNRNGYDLVGKGSTFMSAMYSSVANITGSSMVYSITKDKAQPCDLVSSTKPDNASIPHIGIVSRVQGGMMFIHENSADDNVAENCYFDCQAPAQGKAVKYWRVKALWDGASESSSTCDGKENISLDNSEFCVCDTCDDIVVTPEHIETESKYNNCCKDGNSYLKEYRISKLFCSETDKKLDIQYYNDQCNNDAYKDDKFNTILNNNEYCQVYCTEDIEIKVPDPIESASGKFFKLSELEEDDLHNPAQKIKTQSPVIRGNKTCTIKVNYPEWRKNYIQSLKDEVSNFNFSQEYYALYEITRDAKKSTETLTNTVNFKCTANTATKKTLVIGQGASYLTSAGTVAACAGTTCTVDSYVAKDASYMDASGNTATCAAAACLEYEKVQTTPSTTCNNTYTLYTVNTSGKSGVSCSGGKCSASYYQVKLEGPVDPNTATKFEGVKIVNAGTQTATFEEKTGMPTNDGCSSAIESFKNSQSGFTCEQVGGAPELPDGLKKENMDEKAEFYSGKAQYYGKQLSNNVTSATKLEEAMDTCQNMFDSNKYAAEGSTPGQVYETSKFYTLSPTASFNYMQVYLDGTTRKGDWNKIDFANSKCQYRFDNTAVDDIDSKVVYTSGKYGDGEENMRDMLALPGLEGSSGRIKNETELNTLLDDKTGAGKKVTKKFRRDAAYHALCTWDGADIPEKITLYPGPQVEDSKMEGGVKVLKDQVSEHKYQYALYLTTYKAEYETYWELGGLGGSDRAVEKFMKYFNSDQAKTCADYNPSREPYAYSDGGEKSPEKLIKDNKDADKNSTTAFTCVMTAKYGGMRIGSCTNGIKDVSENCDDNEVKEVFEFKVVDPKEMFPGDWTNKAQNWKKDDGNWGTTYDTINNLADADGTYSPDKLTYSYKLDTATINAIKNYNKRNAYNTYDYDKDNFKCTCPKDTLPVADQVDIYDCGTINKPASDKCLNTLPSGKKQWKYTCRECKSSFLEELTNNHRVKTGDATYTTVKETWNNSKTSFNDVRKKNNWA